MAETSRWGVASREWGVNNFPGIGVVNAHRQQVSLMITSNITFPGFHQKDPNTKRTAGLAIAVEKASMYRYHIYHTILLQVILDQLLPSQKHKFQYARCEAFMLEDSSITCRLVKSKMSFLLYEAIYLPLHWPNLRYLPQDGASYQEMVHCIALELEETRIYPKLLGLEELHRFWPTSLSSTCDIMTFSPIQRIGPYASLGSSTSQDISRLYHLVHQLFACQAQWFH